jgi:2-oxoglutarate ferredoxin oxidoreductase subunit gamma
MNHEIIIAGFGGQGVLFAGKLLAYAGLLNGQEVSWLPSYGPEMRGGTANCHIIISDEPVASPAITAPTALIAMNLPSLEKFEADVIPGGSIILDSTLIDTEIKRSDVKVVEIPATKMASDMNVAKLANMIMMGAFTKHSAFVGFDGLLKALAKCVPPSKAALLKTNEDVLRIGYDHVKY